MDPRHALVEQPSATSGHCSIPSARTASGSSRDRSNSRRQSPRERRPGELLGPLDRASWRSPASPRRGSARRRRPAATPVAQPQVVVGVEEHLGDREVGAGPALAPRSARCRCRCRASADACTGTPPPRPRSRHARARAAPDPPRTATPSRVRDPLPHRVARRVAPHGEHVADAGRGEPPDDVAQLGDRVVHRGQVGHRQQRGVGRDPLGRPPRCCPGWTPPAP